jgi:hypothetical protein
MRLPLHVVAAPALFRYRWRAASWRRPAPAPSESTGAPTSTPTSPGTPSIDRSRAIKPRAAGVTAAVASSNVLSAFSTKAERSFTSPRVTGPPAARPPRRQHCRPDRAETVRDASSHRPTTLVTPRRVDAMQPDYEGPIATFCPASSDRPPTAMSSRSCRSSAGRPAPAVSSAAR